MKPEITKVIIHETNYKTRPRRFIIPLQRQHGRGTTALLVLFARPVPAKAYIGVNGRGECRYLLSSEESRILYCNTPASGLVTIWMRFWRW